MEEQQKQKEIAENKINEAELTVGKVAFGSRTLASYFKVIKFPLIVAVAGIIINYWARHSFDLFWLIDLLVLLYVVVVMILTQQSNIKETATAGGIAGLLIGFFNALFKLIFFHKFYYFFNLISEPALTAFAGIVVGLISGYIFYKFIKKNKNGRQNARLDSPASPPVSPRSNQGESLGGAKRAGISPSDSERR